MFTPGQKQLGKWSAVKLPETNRLSSSIEGAMTALESVSRTNLNKFVSLSVVLLNFRNWCPFLTVCACFGETAVQSTLPRWWLTRLRRPLSKGYPIYMSSKWYTASSPYNTQLSQLDLVLNYFLSNSPFPPSPVDMLEQSKPPLNQVFIENGHLVYLRCTSLPSHNQHHISPNIFSNKNGKKMLLKV